MFSKNGGNLGEQGSVAWMFERKSQIILDAEKAPGEDELMALVLDAGADDLRAEDGSWEVLSAPEVARTGVGSDSEGRDSYGVGGDRR